MLSFLSIYLQTITRCDNIHTHTHTHTHTQELYYCFLTVDRKFPVAQLTLHSMYDLM